MKMISASTAKGRAKRRERAVRHLLPVLLVLLASGLLPSGLGCVAPPEPEGDGALLHQRFPEHAARVLQGHEAFVATARGFTTGAGQGLDAALRSRRGLSLTLPASAEDELRFHLPGFEARVREVGASGPGAVVERAVTYARAGGTAYWTATEQGYEEWLLLGAGQAKGDAPVAAWEVDGATLEQQGEAVSIRDDHGGERLRVTAPAAFRVGGEPVAARLAVRGGRIELSVDAGGEAVLVDPLWVTSGAMTDAREGHTATRINNAKVLVTGGIKAFNLDSVEIYDTGTGVWTPAHPMIAPRNYHTATKLNNGKVLVAGGQNSSMVTSAELYDPATDTWTATGPMNDLRSLHTATLLGNGKVLAAGGGSPSQSTAEVYDPSTNTWTATGPMTTYRMLHTATLLSTGKVLVAGGDGAGVGAMPLSSAELYSPSTNTWSATGSMSTVREQHAAALLAGSKVLVAGGATSGTTWLASAEWYNASTGVWTSTSPMSITRGDPTATVLGSGQVLVAGGANDNGNNLQIVATAEIYTPWTGLWSPAPSMSTPRVLHTATLLANGDVLMVGGSVDVNHTATSSTEYYVP